MTDVLASMGIVQLERYGQILERRRAIIERYDRDFALLGVESLKHYGEGYSSSGHLYLARVKGITEQERNEIIKKMSEYGVATNVHYKPLPMFTAYKNLGFDIKNYPNAFEMYKNEITLPLYTKLSDEDIDYIVDCFKESVKAIRDKRG